MVRLCTSMWLFGGRLAKPPTFAAVCGTKSLPKVVGLPIGCRSLSKPECEPLLGSELGTSPLLSVEGGRPMLLFVAGRLAMLSSQSRLHTDRNSRFTVTQTHRTFEKSNKQERLGQPRTAGVTLMPELPRSEEPFGRAQAVPASPAAWAVSRLIMSFR